MAAAVLAAALGGCANVKPTAVGEVTCPAGGASMARVELIYGLASPSGKGVTEDDWQAYLERQVTPRFPDGLTAYDAYGQWLHPEKGVVRLKSKVLQIWYAPSAEAERRIEELRATFKATFHHLSVMRVDGRDCVSF